MFPQKLSEVYRTPGDHQPPAAKNLAGNLEYPNLNAADVRAHPANISPQLHNCWDSIAISEEKEYVLATNRRHGCDWRGMFFGYSESNFGHMTVDNADFKLQADHAVNIIRYADNNVLLVALGDTNLQAWSTRSTVYNSKNPFLLFELDKAVAHNSPISHMSVFKADPHKCVSACASGDMKMWSIIEAGLKSFYHASVSHSDKFSGLATPAGTASQFVTCDRSGCSRLWDARAGSPSSTTLFNDAARALSFTCAAWAAPSELQGENHVYLGDFDGNVHIADIRVPRKLQETIQCFENSIVSQLEINGTHLAVMSNMPASVKIVRVNGDGKPEFIYTKENIHKRQTDAIWTDSRTLLTVGYGRKMAIHQLDLDNSAVDCGD